MLIVGDESLYAKALDIKDVATLHADIDAFWDANYSEVTEKVVYAQKFWYSWIYYLLQKIEPYSGSHWI